MTVQWTTRAAVLTWWRENRKGKRQTGAEMARARLSTSPDDTLYESKKEWYSRVETKEEEEKKE